MKTVAAALVVCLAAASACTDSAADAAKQKVSSALDATKNKTNQAIDATKDKATQAIDASKTVGDKTQAVAEAGADKTKGVVVTAGNAVTDAWITGKLKAKFADERVLKGTDITIKTSAHVVTLTGLVDSELVKTRAGEVASGTEGVVDVVNQLVVK